MSQLTDMRFLALALAAVTLAKKYDDCNPDVGFGPSADTLIDRVENRASIMFTNHEREILRAQLEK